MKAYLCSVGEKTTQICKEQLERFGFEVVLFDEKEKWEDKYKRFINTANEDCLRVDADVVPNKNIEFLKIAPYSFRNLDKLMIQCKGYDFYKNDIGVIGIVFYRKQAIDIIKRDFNFIDLRRPEATAWRLPDINKYTETEEIICGLHGFGQDEETMMRAFEHKVARKQIEQYDFSLANKLSKL